jgi:hypothetical protein
MIYYALIVGMIFSEHQNLKSYTYTINHKEEIKAKVKKYKEKTNYYANLSLDKKKEYAKRAYLNKKSKLEKEKIENQNI